MRILSFDQASKIAWSVFDDKKLIEYDTKDFSKVKDFYYRINDIKRIVIELIKYYKPTLVVFEDIQYQSNQQTYKKLASLQSVLINYCVDNEILYEIVQPTLWKCFAKIKGRKREEQKVNTQIFIKQQFGIDVDEDIADAIGIGWYSCNEIKVII
jgi:Holliday junction resolvasome RuvABC endonuclease subunit